MKFRRCTDDRSSYDDRPLCYKLQSRPDWNYEDADFNQVQIDFITNHYYPKLLLTYFFLLFFEVYLSFNYSYYFSSNYEYFYYFFLERKEKTNPSILFWNVKLIERLIWLLKKNLLLILFESNWVQSFVFLNQQPLLLIPILMNKNTRSARTTSLLRALKNWQKTRVISWLFNLNVKRFFLSYLIRKKWNEMTTNPQKYSPIQCARSERERTLLIITTI